MYYSLMDAYGVSIWARTFPRWCLLRAGTPTSRAMDFHRDALTKVQSFVNENCLRPYSCHCRKTGNVLFQYEKVVSMNASGVLVEGVITDDAEYHMKQAFLNHDLTKCDCPDEMRVTKVRVVVTNSQWHVVMSKYSKCNFLGAKVDGNRLIMNLGDSAVVPVKAHTEYPDDGILPLGRFSLEGSLGGLMW